MLKNYFITAYRNLIRNREYAIINILGLAVSIAACLMLYTMLRHETSFDAFHRNQKNIYRIVNRTDYPESVDYGEGVPAPLPEAMRTDFQQIRKIGTLFSNPNSQIDIIDDSQPGRELKFREELGVF